MKSWSAEFLWSGSPSDARKRLSEWSGALEAEALEIQITEVAEAATATVRVQAGTILEAYEASTQIAKDLLGVCEAELQFLAAYVRLT